MKLIIRNVMKTIKKTTTLLLLIILGHLTACKKTEGEIENYDFHGKGKIIVLEASYWQYGTHTIYIGNKLYALKSSNIDLYKYNNDSVTIWGNKDQQYPLEGGPELIDVKRIKK